MIPCDDSFTSLKKFTLFRPIFEIWNQTGLYLFDRKNAEAILAYRPISHSCYFQTAWLHQTKYASLVRYPI